MTASTMERRDRLRMMLADLKMPGALKAVNGILLGPPGVGKTQLAISPAVAAAA